jgi:SARP family transcriptional regulator, regulator of embCAB operon
MACPSVRIWLCGELRLEVGGRRVESRFSRRRSRQLLAMLTICDAGLSRERLIELLWPEAPPGGRDGALRQLISELRGCLGLEMLEGRSFVHLALPADAFVDVRAAEDAVHRSWEEIAAQRWRPGRELARAALSLLAGELLPGETGEWVEQQREELGDLELCAIEALAEACLAEPGHRRAGERAARRLVWRAPFRERGWALLMRALLAQGNPAEALRAFERLRVFLRAELCTIPSAELRALHLCALEQESLQEAG